MRQISWLVVAVIASVSLSCDHAEQAVSQSYTCPMHPQYVADKPGACPICGMKLVPVKPTAAPAAGDMGGAPAVFIDPDQRRLLGVKTVQARMMDLGGTIRAVGRIVPDETRMATVQPRFSGFIERLDANFTGKLVRKGDPLA